MARVFELVKKAARSEANILILGESGTGKELIARAIHANSPRAAQAFVPVDCASLPENLLESELFGHEKGAFTGAIRSKPGLIETAHRGTLFLDEIADLPSTLQSKLLRATQERQIRRVGGTTQMDVDVRLVSATNRNLRDAVARGQFREELYYRVNVIAIELPPLRERAGDIPLLAHAFLKRYGQGRVTRIADEAMTALESLPVAGNVRELQNVIERACALADDDSVRRRDLADYVVTGATLQASSAGTAAATPAALGPAAGRTLQEAREYLDAVAGERVPARSARPSWRQRLCRRQGRRDRPQDVPPAGQQVRHPLGRSASRRAAAQPRRSYLQRRGQSSPHRGSPTPWAPPTISPTH